MQAASLASLRIVPAATGQSEGGACKFRSRSKDHRRQAAKQPLATQLRRFRCRVSKEAPSCVKRQLVSDVQPIADEQGEKRADEGQGDASEPPGAPKSNPEPGGKSHVWALALLCLSYLHHSTAGFALPSFLPNISRDLHLLDTQSSYLSVGYTALYALALIPAGLLADKTNRINFLAVAVVLWSGLTMATSKANGFEDLLLIRVGFAVAQAAQNPVCFSLIPELFPKNRSIAMAFYNSAIYLGRALSFAALFALASTQASDVSGVTLVPVNDFDPTQWSLLYTFGDQAAVTPVFNYNFIIDYAPIANPEQWRSALFYIGPPGLFIAWLILITLEEPRYPSKAGLLASSRFFWSSSTVLPKTARGLDTDEAEITAMSLSGQDGARDRVAPTVDSSETTSTGTQILDLLKNRSFLSVTAAATMNDLASWSLVAWQAAFYERVHGIGPEVYAPLLACAIPVGGIFGGVGGALVADKLGSVRHGGHPVLCWSETLRLIRLELLQAQSISVSVTFWEGSDLSQLHC
eukprot:jgi/Tetstr1/428071/TSEL_018126.t1